MASSPNKLWLSCWLILWLGAVLSGFSVLESYKTRPADAGNAQPVWPAFAAGTGSLAHMKLVIALHPRCSCSYASVEQLAQLLSSCKVDVDLLVLIYKPAQAPSEWERTGIWSAAAQLPRAALQIDHDGEQAAALGLSVSGQVALYGADGTLRFCGGITAARGQSGANAAEYALRARLLDPTGTPCVTSVFGCPLANESLFARTRGSKRW